MNFRHVFLTALLSTTSAQAVGEDTAESDHVFEFDATYTGEVWLNRGGIEDGERYLDNLGLAVTADLEALAGWKGATAHGSLLYNNGNALSELTGDSLVASNIEAGVEAVRVFETWIEAPLSDASTVKLGLYDLNSEFDVLETSGLFIGSAHGIGMDIAQTGENGPSIFPITGLAARLDVELSDRLSFRVAALEAVPGDPDDPAATVIDLDRDEGALLIGEFAIQTDRSRVLVGAWRYTDEFERLDGRGAAPNNGLYLRGERLLSEMETGDLRGFARLGLASGEVNQFNAFASAGLVFETAATGSFGVAIAHADVSRRYAAANPGTAAGETVVELTYARPVTDWLEIQPNVQFVMNPSADDTIDDAFAFGIRFTVTPPFAPFSG